MTLSIAAVRSLLDIHEDIRLLVTGGRFHGNQARVFEALDIIHAATPIGLLIHGDCPDTPGMPRSLDAMAADWARSRGIPADPYPADWDNIDVVPCRIKVNSRRKPYNALAGFNRNLRMIKLGMPHLCAAFTGGSGTAHCRAQALRHDVPVLDIHP